MLGRKLLSLTAFCAAALLLLAVAAEAQHSRRRGGFGPGWLLMFPEVQRELKLEPDQLERLQQLGLQMRAKWEESFKGLQELPPEERGRRFMAFDKEYRSRLAEILDRRQSERLEQLGLQREGIRALGRPDVAGELKLSPDQRQRVQAAMDGERGAMRDLFEGVRGNMSPDKREEIRQKMDEIRRGTEGRLNGILTDSQKRQWQGMLGAPFKFPEFRPKRPEG